MTKRRALGYRESDGELTWALNGDGPEAAPGLAEQQRLPQGKARRLARVDGETARCRGGFGGQAQLLGDIQLGSSASLGMDGGEMAGDVNGNGGVSSDGGDDLR